MLWQKQLNSLSVIQFYDKSFLLFLLSFHDDEEGEGNKYQTFMWDFFEEFEYVCWEMLCVGRLLASHIVIKTAQQITSSRKFL